MAPNQNSSVMQSNGNGSLVRDRPYKDPYQTKPGEKPYKMEIVWRNVFAFIYLHAGAIYAFFLPIRLSSFLFGFVYGIMGSYGISTGAHRYFAHRCFKANRKMQLMLLYFQTIAFQNCLIEWVRDHRVHHKFSDTNADPHNATRGFFFSHIGWLMCKKHPDVRKYGAKVDMSDLESDPAIKFQQKYYLPLVFIISFVIPIYLSTLFFDDSAWVIYHWTLFRYLLSLHITWLTNSYSHLWGNRPFEKDIAPADSYIVGFLAFGEGWHNYHHVYPWDYKVSELPRYWCNFSIPFIDFFAWLGWATDLKTVSEEMIRKRVLRTGDGSHRYAIEVAKKKSAELLQDIYNNNEEHDQVDTLWGWGDDDMDDEEKKDVKILHPKFEN